MAINVLGNEFTRVDRSVEREALISYLDTVSALECNRTYKGQSLALLAVQEGDHVLDVGCGTGEDVRTLAQYVGARGRVVGLDYSETMIAEARKRSAGLDLPVEYHSGDAQRLDFPDDTFDGCRVERVLIHLEDPCRALAEMVRVARPGGRVVATEPDWETLVVDAPDRAVTRAVLNFGCDSVRNGWAGRQLASHFKELGLVDIGILPVTIILTDYATANEVLRLQSAAEHAQRAGVVSPADVEQWLSHLERASRMGRFFSAITGFTASGRKRERS
jgi:ubiquinone/menaquinone biosynthesis C-methylase UbiE